jgi:uncharacterized protein YfbU (UPF0304 family)
MSKHLQPKETVEVKADYHGYFMAALERLETLAMGEDTMREIADNERGLFDRLMKGQEVINIQWKAGRWVKYKEAVDLWEKLMRQFINRKREEERVL